MLSILPVHARKLVVEKVNLVEHYQLSNRWGMVLEWKFLELKLRLMLSLNRDRLV
jgi:hypothetical protein